MKNPEIEAELQQINQIVDQVITKWAPMTNPPLSHQPIGMNEKLFLQIRICGEDSLGVRKLKKEYQIELPSDVAGLGEAWLWIGPTSFSGRVSNVVVIPVNSPLPNSSSIEEATPIQHESKVI